MHFVYILAATLPAILILFYVYKQDKFPEPRPIVIKTFLFGCAITLAIKLLKQLKAKKIKTLQTDEYYKDKNNIDKRLLIKKSDIIIVATPHKAYKKLKINKNKVLVDIWGLIEKK